MKNILILDDDKQVCRLFEKLSQQKDVLVTIVKSSENVRKVLQSGKKFDYVFLDFLFPNISSWDILTAIKNDPVNKDASIVIMTGLSLSEEELKRMHGTVSTIIDRKRFNKAQFEEILETSF
ncbi:MAG: response regulator [Kiritimatiellae bacterium]|nr:response regulator [Kiritimatiellia bacterium]MDD5522478.1 response regulator [Kiritimatiellia bacterium]